MIIKLYCPGCKRLLRLSPELAGKKIRCPNQACGQLTRVPNAVPIAAPANPSIAFTQTPDRKLAKKKRVLWHYAYAGGAVLCLLVLGIPALAWLMSGSEKKPAEPSKSSKGESQAKAKELPKKAQIPAQPSVASAPDRLPPTIEVIRVEPVEPAELEPGQDLRLWMRGKTSDGIQPQYQYRTDAAQAWQSVPSDLVHLKSVKAGKLVVQLRAVDSGGTPSSVLEKTWMVQERKRPPVLEIARVIPEKPRQNGSLIVEMKGKDPGGEELTYQFSTEGGNGWQDAEGGKIVLSDLKAGELRLELRARNASGLTSEQITKTWLIPAAAVTPEPVRQFKGHRQCAHALVFTPDGMELLSGSCDATLRLWDTHTTALLHDFAKVAGQIFAMDISPDGQYAVTGGRDYPPRKIQVLQLWDIKTRKEIGKMSGHTDVIHSVKFSPNGKQVASGSSDDTVRLWDVATGKQLRCFKGQQGTVYTVAFSPDGKKILSASRNTAAMDKNGNDYRLRLWDIESEAEDASLPGHVEKITSVNFLADPRYAISSSGRLHMNETNAIDPLVRVWDLHSRKEIRRFVGNKEGVASVMLTFDKKFAFLACGDGSMRLCELEGGGEVHRFEGRGKKMLSVAISRNSHYVVTGSEDGRLLLWDLPKEVHIPPLGEQKKSSE